MKRLKVLVTNRAHSEVIDRLAAVADVDSNLSDRPWPQDDIVSRAHDCSAILAFMTDRIDADFLAACPKLKLVACALKGFDNFDVEACTEAGVFVSIVPDLLTEPTAELAVGLAIGLARNIRDGDALVRKGAFEGWRPTLYGAGLDDATVAIVGMGAVGQAIAQRLAGFGCQILGVDPSGGRGAIANVSLAAALPQADFVFLSAPLNAGTIGLINGEAIRAMKPSAMLINVGRGSVVDEEAIATALAEEQLGGYAADVFAFEDWALPNRPLSISERLLAQPRTLFTPHLGSAVKDVRLAIEMRAADNIIDLIEGLVPRDAISTHRRALSDKPK